MLYKIIKFLVITVKLVMYVQIKRKLKTSLMNIFRTLIKRLVLHRWLLTIILIILILIGKMLDKEPSYNKRLISEMIYIKKQKLGLNKQSNTQIYLILSFLLLLNLFFPFFFFSLPLSIPLPISSPLLTR